MKWIVALVFSASTFAQGLAGCEAQALSKDGKPLAGAAKTSFVKKCQADTITSSSIFRTSNPGMHIAFFLGSGQVDRHPSMCSLRLGWMESHMGSRTKSTLSRRASFAARLAL